VWTVPVNLTVSQLVKVGRQPVVFTLGGRYYADKPEGGPDWGMPIQHELHFRGIADHAKIIRNEPRWQAG